MATVRCEVCKQEQTVNAGECLSHGWPKCHGYTMTFITERKTVKEIEQGMKEVLGLAKREQRRFNRFASRGLRRSKG